MTLNGSFLDGAPTTPAASTLPLWPPSLPADRPEILLARSLQRQVDARADLTRPQRDNLARDHGLALASLCGVGSTELARGVGMDVSAVRKIVRRVCQEAGITRGVGADG